MINKIQSIIISFFLLFSAIHVPSLYSYISSGSSYSTQEAGVNKIVSHSSFVQIPQHVFDLCVKVGKALQLNMLISFSGSETVIKSFYKVLTIHLAFEIISLGKTKNTKVLQYAVKYAKNAQKTADGSEGRVFFMLFVGLQMLLCLLAVKKGNLPYAIISNKYQIARYQL